MIRCNLAILMAEQNLKITKVSNDTGISRTTLTALSSNHSQGIQFDTLNTLCRYLKVEPSQLISYVPVDIKIRNVEMNKENELIHIQMEITRNSKTTVCDFGANYFPDFDLDDFLTSIDISLWLYVGDDEETIKENLFITETFKSLPRPFLIDFQEQLIELITRKFEQFDTSCRIKFNWFDELSV